MTRRTTVTVLVSLVLLAAATPTGVGVAAADGLVSVSVDSPAFPTPEQPFEMSVGVTNSESSDGTYHVVGIEVREGESSSSEKIADRGVGATQVQSGETVRRSVEVTLNDTGERELYAHVILVGPDDERHRIVHPTTLDVNGEHPQLSLATESALPGEARTMTVNVSNGRDDAIRQLSVAVEGDDVSFDDDSEIRARLESGEEAAFSFTARADEAARHPVGVTLSYTTADGERRTVERTLRSDFTPPEVPGERPQLSVQTESSVADAWRALNVTVSNGMDGAVRQVSLDVESDAITVRESNRVTASLAAESERTFSFRAKAADAGTYPVNLTLTYVSDGVQQQLSRTVQADFTPPDNPGNITLTGVSAERRDGTVALSGSAANLGGEAVDSVVVSVADAENVAKAQPQPEYFVGTVEASDFVTFDVNARLSNNRTTVPLKVSYVVDGVTMTRTTEVDVETVVAQSAEATSDGGSSSLPLVGGLVAIALLIGGVWWYRR